MSLFFERKTHGSAFCTQFSKILIFPTYDPLFPSNLSPSTIFTFLLKCPVHQRYEEKGLTGSLSRVLIHREHGADKWYARYPETVCTVHKEQESTFSQRG